MSVASIKRVLIGIQARSTSTRLPDKVSLPLNDCTVLDNVIRTCENSAAYLNRWAHKNKYFVEVAMCVPAGDPLTAKFQSKIKIVEGSESDVLSRYMKLVSSTSADYLVRITSDCPLIPGYVISSLITKAMVNEYDYFSNVDERCRTFPDGWDCEVISTRLLRFVDDNAKERQDREHVTLFIRKCPPKWIKWGTVINSLDLSQLKISIDTAEDYERMKDEIDKVKNKKNIASEIYGAKNVHRL